MGRLLSGCSGRSRAYWCSLPTNPIRSQAPELAFPLLHKGTPRLFRPHCTSVYSTKLPQVSSEPCGTARLCWRCTVSNLQHQRLAELSRELRLSAVPDLYSAIAWSAAAKSASFADFLEEILRAERDARRARAREMFARVAGFPTIKTLDGFDFGFA